MSDAVLTPALVNALSSASDDGGVGAVKVRSTQLTNAQVKALPTAAVQLLPAPGADLLVVVHAVYLLADLAAPYDAIPDHSNLQVSTTNNTVASLYDNAAVAGAVLTALLTGSLFGSSPTYPTRIGFLLGPNYPVDADWGAIVPVPVVRNDVVTVNQPLTVYMSGPGLTDLTGGDAANTLSVRVWYSVVPAAPFGA
jgi:hypothetical protein